MSYIAPIIPANSPFSPAQQAWLNGLLAGLLGPDQAIPAEVLPQVLPQIATPGPAVPAAEAVEEDFPWHDPALPLDERMKLAEGRPFERRLMAAMGQLDCGQCGYLCQSYAEAIARGEEKSFNRCVPGGKETSRMLKELMADPAPFAQAREQPAVSEAPALGATEIIPARFAAAVPLNRAGSEKDTRHVVLRADGLPLEYKVGDALGVHATNDPAMVDAIVERLGADPSYEVNCLDGRKGELRLALLEACDITRPADQAIEVLASRACNPSEADRLQALAEGYPGAEPANADLLDLLLAFPSAQPPVAELVLALGKLEPRLYSIASSPKLHPDEVHLTVGAVRYELRGRLRKGVASGFLVERARPDAPIPVFVRPASGFALPGDPNTPIIMIGPGTGIAPFRAFLQERRELGARGKNWLFFGDQHRNLDFLYEEELEALRKDDWLARLDVAFSRDQAEKIYVQHRMREAGAELWAWIQEGAHIYVCGDATRMARDVDTALAHIIAKQSGKGLPAAKSQLQELGRAGRYQRDVY